MPAGDGAQLWLYGVARRVLARQRQGAVMLMIRPTGPVPPEVLEKIRSRGQPAPRPSATG